MVWEVSVCPARIRMESIAATGSRGGAPGDPAAQLQRLHLANVQSVQVQQSLQLTGTTDRQSQPQGSGRGRGMRRGMRRVMRI